jgi:manganese oxidase
VADQGEWIAIDYFSEGLMIHPMHLHGMDQIVVSKDGHTLEQPYLVDTLNIAPGERYTVLVNTTEVGAWVFHCHILTHAEGPDGLFGMVTALIVN